MFEIRITDNADTALQLLAKLEQRAGEAMIKATRKAGRIVAEDAKQRITAPGYPGDKPNKIALRDSVRVVVREYRAYTVAYVGANWPEGAHGHLVEFGHVLKLRDGSTTTVPPYPWLRPAAEATRPEQSAAIIQSLTKALNP